MHALQISAFGNPPDVTALVDLPEPSAPGPGEALLQIEYAPINPADLLQIRGLYGVRPSLPTVVGNEGLARVLAVGPGVADPKVGDRVLVPRGQFAWQTRMLAPTERLFVTPPEADPHQLAMLAVNPPTAALMLDSYVALKPGDWVLQNAGNSGVGRAVIAFARERNLHVASLVRREELIDELKADGSDVVLLDGRDAPARIADATCKAPIRLALDALAGEASFVLSSALAPRGTLVVYAGISAKPSTTNPLQIIFRNLTVRGFWLGYPEFAGTSAYVQALRDGARLIAAGKLRVPVAGIYAYTEFAAAIDHAQSGGKVLLDFTRS